MDIEKQKLIFNSAPNLFQIYKSEKRKLEEVISGTNTEPFHPIAFGIECGNGWFQLILDCVTKLEEEVSKLPEDTREQFYVVQIKEKYGTLRLYLSYEPEFLSVIIEKAEEESSITCEYCGSKDGTVTRKFGWFKTMCPDCVSKRDNGDLF